MVWLIYWFGPVQNQFQSEPGQHYSAVPTVNHAKSSNIGLYESYMVTKEF